MKKNKNKKSTALQTSVQEVEDEEKTDDDEVSKISEQLTNLLKNKQIFEKDGQEKQILFKDCQYFKR